MKFNIKQFKKKIENIPQENPFDFTEYVKKQKEDDEVDLCLFLELAEENKIYIQSNTSKHFDLRYGKIENWIFLRMVISVWATKGDKILDKYDDHPSIYYTGNIFGYFRNFERVTRSDHGRGADEFNNIQEYKGINCYIPSRNGCFLKCINYILRKDFSMEYFEFIQSYKRKTNVMTRCRIPDFVNDIK